MSRSILERYIAAALFFLVIVVFSFATRDEQRIRASQEARQAGHQLVPQIDLPNPLPGLQGPVTLAR